MREIGRSDARLLALAAVLYMAIPAALLAGLYGASHALNTELRNRVFVLTVVTVIGWHLVSGAVQYRGAITGENDTPSDFEIAATWVRPERVRVSEGESGPSDRISQELSAGYLTLVLTIVTTLGWIVIVAEAY